MNSNKILIAGLLFVIIGCFFTIYMAQNHWDILISRGPVGDFLGGTIAPVINLFGTALIFLSFQQQVRANRIQFDGLQDSFTNQLRIHNYEVFKETIALSKDEFNGKFRQQVIDNVHYFRELNREMRTKIQIFTGMHEFRTYLREHLNIGFSMINADMFTQDKELLMVKYRDFSILAFDTYFKTIRNTFILPDSKPSMKQELIDEIELFSKLWARIILSIEKEHRSLFPNNNATTLLKMFHFTDQDITAFYDRSK